MTDNIGTLDWPSVLSRSREFSVISNQERALARRKKELRDELFALVTLAGSEDDKGHLRLDLPEVAGDILALQVQRRQSDVLNAEKAEEILRSVQVDDHTLWDDCITLVPVLDEDALMASYYNGLLSEDQIDEMYEPTITEAFAPVRVK